MHLGPFYAIRLKGTNKFLPAVSPGVYSTQQEPTENAMPRTFVSNRAARTSLGWWVKGRYSIMGLESVEDRKTEDFEVLPVYITDQPPSD